MRYKKGHIPWTKGRKLSKEHRRKIGEANSISLIGYKHPKKFSQICRNRWLGCRNPMWKGGKRISKRGYVYILCPTHPNRTKGGYVFEHRIVMEKTIGRYLKPIEAVHHINHIHSDNRPKNLMLFTSHSSHHKYHYPKGSRLGKNLS